MPRFEAKVLLKRGFKVGDRVLVLNLVDQLPPMRNERRFKGQEGIIREIHVGASRRPIRVHFPLAKIAWFDEDFLERADD